MTITCPNCGTSYAIDPATFPPEGRKVRCARCREIWQATWVEVPAGAQEVLPPWSLQSDTPESDAAHDAGSAPAASGARLVEDAGAAAYEGRDDALDVEQAAQARARGAARKVVRNRTGRRPGAAFLRPVEAALVGAVLASAVAAVYYREDVVRSVPSAAAVYGLVGLPVNLRGLEFVNLTQRRDFEDGVPVLILEGEIVNIRDAPVAVPAIRFGLRSKSNDEIYAWTVEPRQRIIEPAGSMSFRTRLASPPRAAETVQMRFMERGRRIVEAQP